LAKKGEKVACAVYDWKEKEERIKALQDAGCQVFLLPNHKQRTGRGLKNLLTKLQKKTQLKEAIKKLPAAQYDIVVVNQGGYEIYTTAWKNFYRQLKNYVLLFHNYNEEQIFSSSQKKALQEWMQHASRNLFAAKRIQVVLEEKLSIAISNASVFINPITFDPPKQATPYPSLVDEQYQFAVFAALDVNRKAQDKLLTVLSSEKWKQRAWKLLLYGDGKDKVLLQQLIQQLGLEEKAFLKGHTTDVAAAMKESHLVLQITNIDAMPLSVMEAMAMARPVVVSRIGDMPYWVKPKETGWICDTNLEAIDACLEEGWRARNQWEKIGISSFELFQQKFPTHVEETFFAQVGR
jgi:glycosyltransferase involved in cell wall biosynthesis